MKKPLVPPGFRPFVYLNAAITADGKLAPANRRFVAFGSARDQEHMYELRASADAVMSGARTLDQAPATLGPGGPRFRRVRLRRGLREYNLRVIVSGSGSIDPGAAIFKHRFSPIIILTTEKAGASRLKRLRSLADEVQVCGESEVDFSAALAWLGKKWGVRRLLCEGGGEVNDALFQAGLVDEVHITCCPLILGGRNAPTLADGEGFDTLTSAARLKLISCRHVDEELFLIYEVRRRSASHKSARQA